jgi:Gnt-I system high-affinity gluconate transporter
LNSPAIGRWSWQMTITLVTAVLFTSMYGVGAAIAIGVIALPIMLSQGMPARVAAPAFTMGIGAGTMVNLVQFGTFQKLFPGIQYQSPWLLMWAVGAGIYIICAWTMEYIHISRLGARRV